MPQPLNPHVLLAYAVSALAAVYAAIMGLLGFSAPLAIAGRAGAGASASASPAARRMRRARAATPGSDAAPSGGDRFPGMINLSGTLCYMNSVLQAFASLPTLLQHLERIIALAVQVDVPTPVTDALADTLAQLNTGSTTHPPPLRPVELLTALAPLPQIRRLLATREQQDAHELFVVLAEAVSEEAGKVAKEVARVRGGLAQALEFELGAALPDTASATDTPSLSGGNGSHTSSLLGTPSSSLTPSSRSSPAPLPAPRLRAPLPRPVGLDPPWEGLLARRRMCHRCGYSDVVRMDTLGGMELPVPRSGDVTLDHCITEYLAAERLEDVTCDMCTARATAAKYAAKEAAKNLDPGGAGEKGAPGSKSKATTASAKKKRAQATRLATRLRAMVDSGVPALDAPGGIKWETVRTASRRETTVTRAPRTLRFHFVRSEYTPYGQLLKKTARVAFPLLFDLGAHMARAVWEPRADPAAGVAAALAGAAATANSPNGGASGGPPPRALYRLQSAILHYGYAHSSGHFVAIRRKPGAQPGNVPGRGWLRISDADVEEVGTDALAEARGQVFMLFYERVDLPPPRAEAVSAGPGPSPDPEAGVSTSPPAQESHPGEVDAESEEEERGAPAAVTYPPHAHAGLNTLGLPVLPFQTMAAGPKRSLDSPD